MRWKVCVYGHMSEFWLDEAVLFVAVGVAFVVGEEDSALEAGGGGAGVAVGDEEEGAGAGGRLGRGGR